MKHKGQTTPLAKGEVVTIKGKERNCNKWKIGIVEDLILGLDGVVQVAKLKRGKEHLNGRYNTFTHWCCPVIGRMYRLLHTSIPKPRHSGPGGMQW